MIKQFISQFFGADAKHLEVYMLMRLLLPQLDRQRGNYGLKESNIAKIYAEVLLLPHTEADRLKFWKNPAKQPAGSPTGAFVGILVQVM